MGDGPRLEAAQGHFVIVVLDQDVQEKRECIQPMGLIPTRNKLDPKKEGAYPANDTKCRENFQDLIHDTFSTKHVGIRTLPTKHDTFCG